MAGRFFNYELHDVRVDEEKIKALEAAYASNVDSVFCGVTFEVINGRLFHIHIEEFIIRFGIVNYYTEFDNRDDDRSFLKDLSKCILDGYVRLFFTGDSGHWGFYVEPGKVYNLDFFYVKEGFKCIEVSMETLLKIKKKTGIILETDDDLKKLAGIE